MTTEQRKFIDAYLELRSPTKAMLRINPDMDRQQAGARGSAMLRNPTIQREISLADDAARTLSTLTALERREWIADLVRVDPRQALSSKPHLVNSVDVTRRILETGEVEERVRIKMADKLRAIEIDAKLDVAAEEHDDETEALLSGLDELMGVALPAPRDEMPVDELTTEDVI